MVAATTDQVECRNVGTEAELAVHLRIRHLVFVTEQGIFDRDDHDLHDEAPATVHVVGYLSNAAAGTVRLYPVRSEPGGRTLWQGDRLAVLPEYRRHRLGGPLVQYAVRTAGQLGGGRMIANVQLANVTFFQHLGWARVGEPEPYHGIAHQRMSIGL